MHFQRLRLSGFKSFVDATDFRIEPGLTGVVGPNGCGKSNLLEALRWVMGANSAKAMRGAGMDDVIFAGSGGRPGRNHAEVTLTIDNADGGAPVVLGNHPVLEVVRRIDRGAGSTYRVNGKEVRARDVQLLFADASTGANSPALVRQGQISELIAARPQNRRMILEEAAGVSGLHTRRHEAELKVRAAETNLERLDDLARELEASLGRLRREARQAERYKKLAAQIRALQGAVLHARWAEAREVLGRVDEEALHVGAETERAMRGAAAAGVAAAEAEAAIRPLRDEETTAAAILHRLEIEKDRLDRELEGASAEVARLQAEIARLIADAGREAQIVEDAGRALTRLESETRDLEVEIAAAPERLPELAARAESAAARRQLTDAEVERIATEIAAAEAERRGAETRVEEARSRLSRTQRALDQTKSERAALGPAEDPRRAEAERVVLAAEAALATARSVLEAAEAERALANTAESEARAAARKSADELAALKAEAQGLTALTARAERGAFKPALDEVTPESGLEAALAAALGDDLAAALDKAAPSHWAGAETAACAWPAGATPLAAKVAAPPELAARLAQVALVDAADGPRLMAELKPGQRLVSKGGDLWRWDGFIAKAGAPKPAEARLKQRARLAEVEAQIAKLTPLAQETRAVADAAAKRIAAADQAVKIARPKPREAEIAQQVARERLEGLEREGARRDARAQSLDETVARFEEERAELADQLTEAETALETVAPAGGDRDALDAARAAAADARSAEASTRAAFDVERREKDGRQRRFEALVSDRDGWLRRSETAKRREVQLGGEREKAEAAIGQAKDAPVRVEARRQTMLDELTVAQTRKAKSADALSMAEAVRGDADRAWRAAETAAGEARERRASLAARLDAARDRFAETASAIREQMRIEPDALGKRIAEEANALPQGSAGMETHLAALERERELMGPVNLRAEDDAREQAERLQTLKSERADLGSALTKLRQGIDELNAEGRERLTAAFSVIDGHFRALFTTLFEGGQAELRLVESEDPLEAGLEIFACPPGKRMAVMSLMSGGEQALTAAALIFAVFLANPAPICVLDEVDAPLDDANVERFCNLLDEMRRRAPTRFIAITHNPLTMSRMDRLYGVTMRERGVSQLVSVDLSQAETLAAE
ncbi:MAG TPA: chromosome segregation protein SMC [Caulobacteraceae bacterium]